MAGALAGLIGSMKGAVAFSATGGTITDSGGYRYHTFNASGNFVVSSGSKTVEVLTVGGGGAGAVGYYGGKMGYSQAGGGAAAGVYESKSVVVSTGTHPVLVGAGATSIYTNSRFPGIPSSISAPGSSTTYSVGSTGPAGGLVFFKPGYAGNPGSIENPTGMYFEVAPVSAEVTRTFAETAYQSSRVVVAEMDYGFGYHNTNSIVAQGNSNASLSAAKYCSDYSYNGFSDWFLPSFFEWNLMYYAGNTFRTNAGFHATTPYWSSSDISPTNAYASRADSSFGTSYSKSSSYLVRPVRMFSTTGQTLAVGVGGQGGVPDSNITAGGSGNFHGGNRVTNTSGGYRTGGGSGAGAAGVDGTWDGFSYYPLVAGNGGAGTTWNGFKSFGGGGGGGSTSTGSTTSSTVGSGGSFGGGSGGTINGSGVGSAGTAGTTNTGGGGGGGAYDWAGNGYYGGNGGSGVVIVRYLL